MDVISADQRSRSEQLAVELHKKNHRRIDRIFVGLMLLQWCAGILTAMYLSPYTWIGERSLVHTHVWASLVLGGLISAAPVALGIYLPGHTITRHVIEQ